MAFSGLHLLFTIYGHRIGIVFTLHTLVHHASSRQIQIWLRLVVLVNEVANHVGPVQARPQASGCDRKALGRFDWWTCRKVLLILHSYDRLVNLAVWRRHRLRLRDLVGRIHISNSSTLATESVIHDVHLRLHAEQLRLFLDRRVVEPYILRPLISPMENW